jgi:hypothetical protein
MAMPRIAKRSMSSTWRRWMGARRVIGAPGVVALSVLEHRRRRPGASSVHKGTR